MAQAPSATGRNRVIEAEHESHHSVRPVPQAGERLRDGRLSLASLAKLKDALTAQNVEEVFERAAGKTVEEAPQLACAYAPRPVPQRDLLRREAPVPVAPSTY